MKGNSGAKGKLFGVYLPEPLFSRVVAQVGVSGLKNRNAVIRQAIAIGLESIESDLKAKTPAA